MSSLMLSFETGSECSIISDPTVCCCNNFDRLSLNKVCQIDTPLQQLDKVSNKCLRSANATLLKYTQSMCTRTHYLSPLASTLKITLHITLQPTFRSLGNPIAETDSHGDHERETKDRRAPLVVVADRHAPFDLVDAP